MKGEQGFTLTELILTMTIAAILVAVAAPSFDSMVNNNRVTTEVNRFISHLQYARSEAIKRGIDVSICASDDAIDCKVGTWTEGWIVFVDNDGDADGDTGSIDAGDIVIRVFETLGAGSTISSRWICFPMIIWGLVPPAVCKRF